MSCGSNTCNSTQSSVPARDLESATRHSRLARIWARIGVAFDKMRWRQFSIELEKARQRGILLELDDRLLSDIGLTRDQAIREARKRFWK